MFDAWLFLLWFIPSGPSAAPAPLANLCEPLPPCRVQSSQISGPSFAITQGGCKRFRYISARFLTGCEVGCGGPDGPPCESPHGLHVPESSLGLDLHGD